MGEDDENIGAETEQAQEVYTRVLEQFNASLKKSDTMLTVDNLKSYEPLVKRQDKTVKLMEIF